MPKSMGGSLQPLGYPESLYSGNNDELGQRRMLGAIGGVTVYDIVSIFYVIGFIEYIAVGGLCYYA